jgi:hypothetical protein
MGRYLDAGLLAGRDFSCLPSGPQQRFATPCAAEIDDIARWLADTLTTA